jgi:hypothetical protein
MLHTIIRDELHDQRVNKIERSAPNARQSDTIIEYAESARPRIGDEAELTVAAVVDDIHADA